MFGLGRKKKAIKKIILKKPVKKVSAPVRSQEKLEKLDIVCDFADGSRDIRYFYFNPKAKITTNPDAPDFPFFYQYKILKKDRGSLPAGYLEQFKRLHEIAERQHIDFDVLVNHLGLSVQGRLYKLKQEATMLAQSSGNNNHQQIASNNLQTKFSSDPTSKKTKTAVATGSKLSPEELQAFMQKNKASAVDLNPENFKNKNAEVLTQTLTEIKKQQTQQNLQSLLQQIKNEQPVNKDESQNEE